MESQTAEGPEGALFTPKLITIPKQLATTLSFSRVKYVLQDQPHAEPRLQNISYKLNPGTCCCIVDGTSEGGYAASSSSSGSGGDSSAAMLLQVLAGKTRSVGKTTGVICANDQRLGERYTCFCI